MHNTFVFDQARMKKKISYSICHFAHVRRKEAITVPFISSRLVFELTFTFSRRQLLPINHEKYNSTERRWGGRTVHWWRFISHRYLHGYSDCCRFGLSILFSTLCNLSNEGRGVESTNTLPLVIAASHVFHVQRIAIVQTTDDDNDVKMNDVLSISPIRKGDDHF